MATTVNGYWLVGSDGGIFAFGDAVFAGSRGGTDPKDRYIGMIASPDRKGYHLGGHHLTG